MIVLIILAILVAYAVICLPIYFKCQNAYKNGQEILPAPRDAKEYYTLQLTWGIILNIIGAIVALVLFCCGHRPVKYGWNYCFELDVDFGLELGVFFIAPKNGSTRTKNHEHGHGVQNAYLGPFFIGVVAIPSAVRYWLRKFARKKDPDVELPDYDDIWFEGQATKTGKALLDKINGKEER